MDSMHRLAAGFLALGIWGIGAPAGAEEARRTVSLSGTAMVKVVPDEVMISLGVEIHQELPASQRRDYVVGSSETLKVSAPLLAEAQARSEQAVKAVREVLKGLGVEERQVRTDSFQVAPRTWEDDGVSYFRGYLCSQAMTVVLKDPGKADACVQAVLKHGATHVYGVTFQTTQVRRLRDQARQMACKAAREKADLLAGELGAKVKRVLTLSEGGSSIWCGKNWSQNRYGQQEHYAQNVQFAEMGPAQPEGEAGELASGEVGISASVSVVFELE
jgi:uncharacterized protein YggE